ncbi:hypothetical protein [Pelotalea chapellei]|uniref:Uncharacterized protein n=1 Tax=Pelotalea chapellei TaxID=44671 RepID=A0ABS5UCZ3_9BACT|nr:hypothetical protein [Pelotalea chapellei]MBT1073559.1 hypothetical protein [Pelotalea chapellei]
MFKERVASTNDESRYTGTDNDLSLNFSSDQKQDIKRQLRTINWKRTPEMAGAALSAILLGAAGGFLVKGKLLKATLCVVGFLYQQGLKEEIPQLSSMSREKRDRELERYALKAQRGDYGKLEVIPFR